MSGSSSSGAGDDWQSIKSKFKHLRTLVKSKSKESEVKEQVDELLTYFVDYFESPHRYQAENVLEIMSGIKCSPLEASFMWLGAWRPSAAISHIFSVMQLRTVDGFTQTALYKSNDPLSEEQGSRLLQLQSRCSKVERDLSNVLANVQMMLPDQGLVSSVMVRSCISDIMGDKVSSLSDVLRQADALRISTLREVHSILNPMQAGHCSLAAFELAFAMRSLDSSTRQGKPREFPS